MAQKRMFSKDIVRTDRFLDMSLSTQALYFHLCLDADVKGFVSPRAIMRLINATTDDLNVLITKGFVIQFESGVIVVTDWNVHNNVRDDREARSQFEDESKRLLLSGQGVYQLQEYSRNTPAQIRLDQSRLDKTNSPETSSGVSSFKKRETKCPNPKGHKDCVECIDSIQKGFNKKFINYPKQLNAYHKIISTGFTEEQVQHALDTIDEDKFYSVKGWDLMDLVSVLSKGGLKYEL